MHIQLNTDDLHFEDSLQRNQEVTKADAWSWIVILIILFFVISTILASIASWYFKRETEKRQAERRAKLA